MRTHPPYVAAALAALLLGACSSGPPLPDWQLSAHSALERSSAAYLAGHTALAQTEFQRARSALAGTGKVELVLQAELLRCATRVAALVFEACPGYEALRQDAGPAQQAYADYLAGQRVARPALLPPAQQALAQALAGAEADAAKAVQDIAEPLSRLVAAGVLLRSGKGSPALIAIAVETASIQGWRRPLLAWLGVQAMGASAAGDLAQAQRIQRRIALASSPAGASD